MTFTEAAAQVLRLVGKPLHYKEITDVAIEKNLLSHVGKSPEVTMGARLAALVKKGEKDNPLIRIKPGVFGLRDWDQETIDTGLADRTPALERLAASEGTATDSAEEAPPGEESAPEQSPEPPPPPDEEPTVPDEEEQRRAEMAAGATEFFDAEEDDDEPIFGGAASAAPEEERPEGGRRRRRRRRRGGRNSDEASDNDDDLPSYTVSDAPDNVAELAHEVRAARSDRESKSVRKVASLAGRELSGWLVELLETFDKNRGPVSAQSLCDQASRRGATDAEGSLSPALLLAVALADNERSLLESRRPRFRVVQNKIGLSAWGLDSELARQHKELELALARYREASRRAVLKSLSSLPQRALGELLSVLLERLGATEVKRVRRQGTHGAELHLCAMTRVPGGEIPTAIVIRRDGRDVGRERVTELRGTLHHYGPASAGWLITTGQVLSGAREEARASGAAPVSLFDGALLARLCEEHGVGISYTRVLVPTPNTEIFEALRST